MLYDNIPKGIRIKELNEGVNNGKTRQHSFLGATSKQLLHYVDVSLDNCTDTVLIRFGINDISNSISDASKLILNIIDMVKKCRKFGVKHMFVSGLLHVKRIKIQILQDIQKELLSVCKEMQVHFADNIRNRVLNLIKEGLHLLDAGRRLLANNFVDNVNNFLSVMHRPSLFS